MAQRVLDLDQRPAGFQREGCERMAARVNGELPYPFFAEALYRRPPALGKQVTRERLAERRATHTADQRVGRLGTLVDSPLNPGL